MFFITIIIIIVIVVVIRVSSLWFSPLLLGFLKPQQDEYLIKETLQLLGRMTQNSPGIQGELQRCAAIERYAQLLVAQLHDSQIQELIEAVVLPMTHKERFDNIGIKPPKGALMHGPAAFLKSGRAVKANRTASAKLNDIVRQYGPIGKATGAGTGYHPLAEN